MKKQHLIDGKIILMSGKSSNNGWKRSFIGGKKDIYKPYKDIVMSRTPEKDLCKCQREEK